MISSSNSIQILHRPSRGLPRDAPSSDLQAGSDTLATAGCSLRINLLKWKRLRVLYTKCVDIEGGGGSGSVKQDVRRLVIAVAGLQVRWPGLGEVVVGARYYCGLDVMITVKCREWLWPWMCGFEDRCWCGNWSMNV